MFRGPWFAFLQPKTQQNLAKPWEMTGKFLQKKPRGKKKIYTWGIFGYTVYTSGVIYIEKPTQTMRPIKGKSPWKLPATFAAWMMPPLNGSHAVEGLPWAKSGKP